MRVWVGQGRTDEKRAVLANSSWTTRRFLLRDGFVMAAAGMHPPWPPLLKGGRGGAGRSPEC